MGCLDPLEEPGKIESKATDEVSEKNLGLAALVVIPVS